MLPRRPACADVAGYAVWFSSLAEILKQNTLRKLNFNFSLRFGPVVLMNNVLPRRSACADVAGYAVWFSSLEKNPQKYPSPLLGTQGFPSLGAAASNRLPSMPRGHPFPEAQFIFPLPTMRLICALHVLIFPFPNYAPLD